MSWCESYGEKTIQRNASDAHRIHIGSTSDRIHTTPSWGSWSSSTCSSLRRVRGLSDTGGWRWPRMATDGDGHRATSDRTWCQDFVEVIIINYPFSRYSSEFLTSGTEAWQHPGDSLRYHVSIYMFCGSWWFLVVLWKNVLGSEVLPISQTAQEGAPDLPHPVVEEGFGAP